MKNPSIIISSCDKYHYLWDIQLQFFNKYWNNCPYDIFVVSESSKIPDFKTNLKLINYNTNKPTTGPSDWSSALSSVLEHIESEYIIYMQEDYIFTDYVNQNKLDLIFDYVEKNDINYIRFYTSPPGNGNSIELDSGLSIKEILPNSKWRTSLMVAIWKKQTLLSLLDTNQNINPWQFENIHSSHLDKFYCIDLPTNDSSDVLPFLGMYGSTNNYTFYPMIIDLLNKEGIKKLDGSEIDFNIKL
jgi:hypothetical protein